jgi:hypothetical protein
MLTCTVEGAIAKDGICLEVMLHRVTFHKLPGLGHRTINFGDEILSIGVVTPCHHHLVTPCLLIHYHACRIRKRQVLMFQEVW